jgi:hypothetical protein
VGPVRLATADGATWELVQASVGATVYSMPATPADDPPVFESWVKDYTIAETERISMSIEATDDEGSAFTYAASALPPGATFTFYNGGWGFDWTTAVGQAGTYAVTFTASDGNSSASKTITITVTPAPAATAASTGSSASSTSTCTSTSTSSSYHDDHAMWGGTGTILDPTTYGRDYGVSDYPLDQYP